MISCLDDYIGLLYVSDAPTSGRYLNDLYGVRTEKFTGIRDESETYDDLDAWTILYNRTNRLFETDIIAQLKKYMRRYSLFSTVVSHYNNTNDLLSAEGKYKGILFDFTHESYNTKLVIENVFVYASGSDSITFKIFDATLGTELHSVTKTVSEGLNTFTISKEYATHKYQRIFVCYDDTGTSLYKVIWHPNASFSAATSKGISTTSNVLHGSMAAEDIGMGCTFSLKCSIDNLVCQRIEMFADAFLYKLGIEFMKEAKFSDRVNRWTILDRDEIDQAINEYEKEYTKQLAQIFEGMVVPDDGICFECAKDVTYKQQIP